MRRRIQRQRQHPRRAAHDRQDESTASEGDDHGYVTTLILTCALAGCTGLIDAVATTAAAMTTGPVVCEPTRTYAGFGGAALASARPALTAGADRLRI